MGSEETKTLKRGKPKMCIINPALVEDMAPLTGSQNEIMRRIGISWNSWIKISAGLPIRLSVGRRLRDRMLSRAHEIEGFRRKFAATSSPDGIDHAALEAAFLRPALISIQPDARHDAPLRSVQRARQLLAAYRSQGERHGIAASAGAPAA